MIEFKNKQVLVAIGCGDSGEHEINRITTGGDWDWDWVDRAYVPEDLLIAQEKARAAYRAAWTAYNEACNAVHASAKWVEEGQQ